MKKRTYQIIIVVLMLGVVSFYIWDLITNNKEITDNLFKFLVIELMLAGSLIRWSNNAGRQSVDFYEKQYADEVADAFEGNILRKKLLCATRLYNEGNYRKALKYLDELMRDSKTVSEKRAVLLFTALCYTDMDAVYPAIEVYRELLKVDPEYDTAYSNLGLLYEQCGDSLNAILNYKKSIELNPTNHYAVSNIAHCYFRLHDYDKAIIYANKTLEILPTFKNTLSLLAIIYHLKNDIENCEKYYQMSIAAGQDADELKEAFKHYSLEHKNESGEEDNSEQ